MANFSEWIPPVQGSWSHLILSICQSSPIYPKYRVMKGIFLNADIILMIRKIIQLLYLLIRLHIQINRHVHSDRYI